MKKQVALLLFLGAIVSQKPEFSDNFDCQFYQEAIFKAANPDASLYYSQAPFG